MTSVDSTWTVVSDEQLPAQISRIGAESRRWLVDNVSEFDPLCWRSKRERKARRKAFGECGLCLHLIENEFEMAIDPAFGNLLADRGTDDRFIDFLSRHPRRLPDYAFPLAYLAAAEDQPEPALERVYDGLDRPAAWGRERRPYLALSLWYFCELIGYTDCPLDGSELASSALLERPPDPIESDKIDAYALTHDIMFLTNFGGTDASLGTRSTAEGSIGEVLPGMVLRHMADDDHDIVLELVMIGVIQRAIPPSLAGFALSWVESNTVEQGHVPGKVDNVENITGHMRSSDMDIEPEQGETWDEDSSDWFQHYHPNLVATLLEGVIQTNWVTYRTNAPSVALDHDEHQATLLALAECLHAFADYKLERGAAALESVLGTPVADAYDETVERVLSFLEYQQRPDDTYGYWTDERLLYTNADRGTPEQFERELVSPVANTCSAVFQKAEAARDD